MAEFFMGQVMMTGFGYAQKYFAQCNGALLPVTQYGALYTLLGITYGGTGATTFALPDLRGRTPAGGFVSQNTNWAPSPYLMGMVGGTEKVSLFEMNNPMHTHFLTASTDPGTSTLQEGNQVFAATGSENFYGPPTGLVPQTGSPASVAGAGQPHENMQPFQAINFNIALTGIYPSRN